MYSDFVVLLVSDDPAEAFVFEGILGENTVLKRVQDLPELQDVLEDGIHYDAVLCGWSTRKGTWKDALGEVLQRCPDLRVVVFLRTGTEREWIEVPEAGAFDLLTAPYVERTVLPVLEQAVTSCRVRRLRNGGNGDSRKSKSNGEN
jgi:DNA-binding NtrC family response regulator